LLRKTFGPKRDEVTREWKGLYNEKLSDFSSSKNQINKNEMNGASSAYGKEERCIWDKPEGKTIL